MASLTLDSFLRSVSFSDSEIFIDSIPVVITGGNYLSYGYFETYDDYLDFRDSYYYSFVPHHHKDGVLYGYSVKYVLNFINYGDFGYVQYSLKYNVSAFYSVDCPYSYKLYYVYVMTLAGTYEYLAKLSILKNTIVLFDEYFHSYFSVDINAQSTINYAQGKLNEYVKKCIDNLKIETTCCVLACCEPDKYKLI